MNTEAIRALGGALIHFLWEGAVLGLAVHFVLLRLRDARARYGFAVAGLAFMAVCPAATFLFLFTPVQMVRAENSGAPASVVATNLTVAFDSAKSISSFDLLTCMVWIWCSGVFIFGMRALGGWIVLQRLRRTAHQTISPVLFDRCRRLQAQLGIAKIIRFAHSEIVEAPAVVGWVRPVVLLPLSAFTGLTSHQIDAIIAHELAHIKRYDALVNLFQVAVETLLFYHPAVWWVNRIIRVERENCCDDFAVAVCGDPGEYARALTILNDSSARHVWAMAATGGDLKARIARLLGIHKIAHGAPKFGLLVVALMCASCMLVAASAFRQDVPPPPSPPNSVPPSPAAVVQASPVTPTPPIPDVEGLELQVKTVEGLELQVKTLERHLKQNASHATKRDLALQYNQLQRDVEKMSHSVGEREQAALHQLAISVATEFNFNQTISADVKPQEHNGPSYIDSLAAVGLAKLTVDELIALKVQGVTSDYVRQIKAAGFDPNVHELLALKVQGVTPEYIRDIRATGLKPTAHDIMGMKVQGVTPEYIRALQSAGLGDLQIRDFISAKVQGITPEFIEKVRSHGFKDLTFRQLISLKVAGVF